jgi:hypothetical protein
VATPGRWPHCGWCKANLPDGARQVCLTRTEPKHSQALPRVGHAPAVGERLLARLGGLDHRPATPAADPAAAGALAAVLTVLDSARRF